MPATTRDPIIGITCNIDQRDAAVRRTYIDAVRNAGGVPILLPPPSGTSSRDAAALAAARRCARAHLALIDALIFTGGQDPDLTHHRQPNHPASTLMQPERQIYEEALLAELDALPELPALGICLGMQQMSLHAGGLLDPHLPDTTPTAADHTKDNPHPIAPALAHLVITSGAGASAHHQAVRDPGSLRIVARAPDGVIEAIDDPRRRFYLGVQWHPERTHDPALGARIFEALIEAARAPRP